MKLEQYFEQAEQYRDSMTACRRDLHKYPESGWREFRTTAKIIGVLKEHKIPFRYGYEIINKDYVWSYPSEKELCAAADRAVAQGADPEIIKAMNGSTGACAVIETGKPGPVVALRVDIDCNDVGEDMSDSHLPAAEGFCSVNAGCTHACGHDGHATLGIYTCLLLNAMKEDLSGTIKIIFQPAEEGVRGAQSVAESGILDDVDIFLTSHLGMGWKTGQLVALSRDFLSTTKIDAVFHGVSSHAGMSPQDGRSAILAACAASLGMHTVCQDSRGASRINVGTFHGGTGRNVVADKAVLQIETRGETTEIERNVYHRAMESLEGAAKMFGCTVETEIKGSASSSNSDHELEPYIRAGAGRISEITEYIPESGFSGSEDATYLMAKVQSHGGKAAYMGLGANIAAPHHNGGFDFDESVLVTGVKLYASILWEILHK